MGVRTDSSDASVVNRWIITVESDLESGRPKRVIVPESIPIGVQLASAFPWRWRHQVLSRMGDGWGENSTLKAEHLSLDSQ